MGNQCCTETKENSDFNNFRTKKLKPRGIRGNSDYSTNPTSVGNPNEHVPDSSTARKVDKMTPKSDIVLKVLKDLETDIQEFQSKLIYLIFHFGKILLSIIFFTIFSRKQIESYLPKSSSRTL